MRHHLCWMALSILTLTACSNNHSQNSYTLYRNSPFGISERVHWATFDANESNIAFNMNNCMMAARLLNANVDAASKQEGVERNPSFGFWCESGKYKAQGSVPTKYYSAFPTDI